MGTDIASSKRIFGVFGTDTTVSRIFIPWVGNQNTWVIKVLDAASMTAIGSTTISIRIYHS